MKKLTIPFLLCLMCFFVVVTIARNKEEETESVDNSVVIDRISNNDIDVIIPSVIFTFKDAEIKLKFKNPNHTKLLLEKNKLDMIINGEDVPLAFTNGEASFMHRFDKDKTLSIYIEDFGFNRNVTAYPLWALLLPLLLIIAWVIRKKIKK